MKGEGKLEWFDGNIDAYKLFQMFIELSHTWDDIVDNDKNVSEDQINKAFLIALVYMPSNPFYQSIQQAILPMWIPVVSAYKTANMFEKEKDEHGIEIAHNLRYAAGYIISYMVHACVGYDKAQEFMPDVWKAVVFERFDDYRKEHLNVVL
jgi:hypothetical protein